jgi:hypothetical protein
MNAPLVTPSSRGRPHAPVPDRETPGTCATCHRPLKPPNDMHQLPPVDPAAAELDARRLGERRDR